MAGMLIPLALGIPGLISGIMDAVSSGKRLAKGGRIKRYVRVKRGYGGRVKHRARKVHRKYGKGIAADIASALPLIGPLAGPLVRALGGRVHYRVRHKIRRGHGLGYSGNVNKLMYPHLLRMGHGLPNTHIYQPIAVGAGLLGPGSYRPSRYGGLLSPTGGKVHRRKGHYRRVGGMIRYIKPTLIHRKKNLLMY